MSKDVFLESLDSVISNDMYQIDVVMCDFNDFDEDDSCNLKLLMSQSNYVQLVKSATFIFTGSLLDHIYARSDLRCTFWNIECIVKCVYYSDHDSVQLCLHV